jgi:hypothetical protein
VTSLQSNSTGDSTSAAPFAGLSNIAGAVGQLGVGDCADTVTAQPASNASKHAKRNLIKLSLCASPLRRELLLYGTTRPGPVTGVTLWQRSRPLVILIPAGVEHHHRVTTSDASFLDQTAKGQKRCASLWPGVNSFPCPKLLGGRLDLGLFDRNGAAV